MVLRGYEAGRRGLTKIPDWKEEALRNSLEKVSAAPAGADWTPVEFEWAPSELFWIVIYLTVNKYQKQSNVINKE